MKEQAAPVASQAMKHLKVSLSDDTRRFSVVDDGAKFAQLCKNVRDVYNLPANAALLFKYKDEEGDLISVSSESELIEAFRVAGATALRLSVFVTASAAAAPAQGPKAAKAGPLKAPAVVRAAAILKAVTEAQPAAAPAPAPASEVAPMLRLTPATPAAANACAAEKAAAPKAAAKPAADPKVALLKERNEMLKERVQLFKTRMQELRAARAAGQLQVQSLQRDLVYERASHNPKCKAVLARGRFVCDVSVPDGTVLSPGEVFTKTWRFRNDSDAAWPAGSRLLFVGKNSDRMSAPDEVVVEAEVLPGTEIDISVPLTAPNAPGRYVTYFRLSGADQKKFGQRVWCSVIVREAGSSSEEEAANNAAPADADMVKFQHQLQVLAEMNLTNLRLNVRLLNKFDGNLEAVVERLFARKAKFAARAAANPKAAQKEEKTIRKLAKVERKTAKMEERLVAKAEKLAAKAEKKADKSERID